MQQKPASKGDFEAGWRSRCSVDTDNATPLQLAHWAYNNLTTERPPVSSKQFRTSELIQRSVG
jgi:hypothetical protein